MENRYDVLLNEKVSATPTDRYTLFKKAYTSFANNVTPDTRDDLREAKASLREAYASVEAEQLNEKLRKLQDEHNNVKHSQAWTLINDITQRKSANKGKLAGETEKERIENWYKHFCGLLGAKPSEDAGKNFDAKTVLPPQNIETGPFTKQEFEKAKSSLKMGKACGPDGIPPEVFRLCDFDDLLLQFCNDTLLKRDKPEQWSTPYLIPVPKSGDLSLTENYRGIALTCVIIKLYNKMLLNRIHPHIDKHLRKNQNGFRAGRSTVSQVLALRRIIEGLKSKNLSAIITFVDFKKAFDSINREIMFKILAAYGIPQSKLWMQLLLFMIMLELMYYHQMGKQTGSICLLVSCKVTLWHHTFSSLF